MSRSSSQGKSRKSRRSVSFEPATGPEPPSQPASSSDDIRSFCDSISHVAGKLSKSLSIFGWTDAGPPVNQQPPPTVAHRYRHLIGLERSYTEPALGGPCAPGMTVSYEPDRDVQEMTFWGTNQCLEKQTRRGARNPWRQYGALRKLHEIGGNAPERLDKKGRKKGANYVKIMANSQPPPAPQTPEIVLNGTRDVALLKRLHCPPGVPADLLAQRIAVEMIGIGRELLEVGGQQIIDGIDDDDECRQLAQGNKSRSRKSRNKSK